MPDLRNQRPMYQTCEHSGSSWNLEVLVFRREENRIIRKKNLSEQRKEPRTNCHVSFKEKVIQRDDRRDGYYSKTREYTDS